MERKSILIVALAAAGMAFSSGCVTTPRASVSETMPNWKRAALQIRDYDASAVIYSDRWWRGRLALAGVPLKPASDYPVERNLINFVESPGKSSAIRSVRVLDGGKTVIFSMDQDNRPEWLILLNSGKPLSFWVRRLEGNTYDAGMGTLPEAKRILAEDR